MKRGIAIFSFILLGISYVFGQSGWTNTAFQSTQTGSNNVVEVFFLNADSGLVITENGSQSRFWYTENGGTTWTQDTILSSINSFSSPNPFAAWVCGDGGSIYKGTLGINGMSWLAQTSGTTSNLNDIQMYNPLIGYAVGDGGVFKATTNGGSTWTSPVVSGLNYDFAATHFSTSTKGYVVGTYNFFQGFISKTVSGGQYWGTPFTAASGLNDITFPTEAIGYAVGNGGSVYKTTNGASNTPSWTLKSTGVTTPLLSVFFLNVDTGFVVGENGLILKTMDGGTTWQNQSLPTSYHANRVWAVDYNTIYVGLDSNDVYKTTSSGIGLNLTTTNDSVYCNGYANLQTNVAYNGTGTITYTWASSPFLSSTSGASPSAGPLTSTQTFYVTATDGTLSDNDSITISVVPLITDSICLVTVDDSLGHNLLVFEQHIIGPVDYYTIYREGSSSGVWDTIAYIPADSAGVYIDTASNPAVKQYSYRISTTDSCGNESLPSKQHTTMHLTVNQGTGSNWNLIWFPYQGLTFPTYRIWRGDTLGNWALIDSVASTSTSYTDLNPPAGGLYYQVEIVSLYTCQPYLYSKAKTNYNTSRSNVSDNGMIAPPPSLSANFSANPTVGIAPLQVQFLDLSQLATEWYWDFGDGDTSMVQNPTHTYTTVGIFNVKLKVSDGQDWDSIEQTNLIDVASLINNINLQAEIKVFPNPTVKGQALNVEYKHIRIEEIQLIDIVGRQVTIQYKEENGLIKIELPSAEAGVYILQIRDHNNKLHQRKVVIK